MLKTLTLGHHGRKYLLLIKISSTTVENFKIKIRQPNFSCDFAKQFVNYINLGLNFSWTNKTIGFTCCPRLSQKKWWIRILTEKGQSYLSGPRFNFRLLTNEIDIDDDDLHDDVGSEVTTKSCWTILSGIKEGWGCCNFFWWNPDSHDRVKSSQVPQPTAPSRDRVMSPPPPRLNWKLGPYLSRQC